MPKRAAELTVKSITAALKAFERDPSKSTKTLSDGKVPCLKLVLTRGATGVNAKWTYFKQKGSGSVSFNRGLGGYPDVSLAEAREKAVAVAKEAAQGLNAVEEARKRKEAAKAARERAVIDAKHQTPFRVVADLWLHDEERSGRWTNDSKGASKARSRLKTNILPVIGDVPMNEVDRSAVIQVGQYRDLATRKASLAKCFGIINDVCLWAFNNGYREASDSPADLRDRVLKAALQGLLNRRAPSGHHPALPPEHMPEFMKQLRSLEGTAPRALEFIILTACRQDAVIKDVSEGNVLGLKWEHLDLEKGLWHQPREMTKMKRDHGVTLPLSSYAVELLRGLPRFADSEFVFPSRDSTLSNGACVAVIKRMNAQREEQGLSPWVDPQQTKIKGRLVRVSTHGMRASFASWCISSAHGNSHRFDKRTADLCLDHEVADQYGGAYMRDGLSVEDEKAMRELLDAWGRYCYTGKWPDEPDE